MLKVFICEDEKNTLESIINIIDNYCPETEVAGFAQSVKEAVNKIPASNADLLLMDINFPDGTGFDILNDIDIQLYDIIFITAHEKYALRAIKLSASDFILKPLNPKELIASVEKIKNKISVDRMKNLSIETLLANSQINEAKKRKIVLKTQEHIHVVKIEDIIHCESESSYTTFYFKDHDRIVVSKNLKEYDELLVEFGFIRTHKSHLVNSEHINLFDRNSGYLLLSENYKVPVSVRRKDYVLNSLNDLMK
jgi:two-component system LytT family response regulator